jgi:RND family efflux transporter MFP subunit
MHRFFSHLPASAIPRPMRAALALALLAAPLAACNDHHAATTERPVFVHTEIVRPQQSQDSLTLTGEVQARFSANLSFRVTGRVIARMVEVGDHANAGDVLAVLDPVEQQADVDAATAAVASAEAQLRVAQATHDRQQSLITSGFTTRTVYDQAQEGLRTAEGALEAAKAQLGTAKDALGFTKLRAEAAGVITARNVEVGQVVQAAQSVFSLAQDGERDAVFYVYESAFLGDTDPGHVSLKLVSDSSVTASGRVREVSPVVDPKSSTIRVKVSIENPPPAMTLGSAVAGTVKAKAEQRMAVPWRALMAAGSKPAVWIVDPATRTVSLKPIAVGAYDAREVLIKSGLRPGERVVI